MALRSGRAFERSVRRSEWMARKVVLAVGSRCGVKGQCSRRCVDAAVRSNLPRKKESVEYNLLASMWQIRSRCIVAELLSRA